MVPPGYIPDELDRQDGAGGRGDVVRFGWRPRVEHALLLALFVVLCATGLPQRTPDAGWASALLDLLGGVGAARRLHHAAGFGLGLLALSHFAVNLWLLVARGCTSMLITPRDFADAARFLRWCLGSAADPPRMGRYHYRQKFEYWALTMGIGAMLLSGTILLYPMWVAAHLPGVLVAAARMAHGSDALLALGVALGFHLYATLLNPEVFPLDTSIFTGRISRERLRREHALEAERPSERPGSRVDDR